jgi:hypothetical protein
VIGAVEVFDVKNRLKRRSIGQNMPSLALFRMTIAI